MKKTLKKIVLCLLVALLALSCLTACGGKDNTSGTASSGSSSDSAVMAKIKSAGKLVVYTEAGFAPYEFLYNNEIVGVDMQIAAEIAKELGVTLEVTDVAFDTICAAVKSGKADLGTAGITITDERKESVDFSDPYTSTAQYVVLAIDNDTIKTVEDLAGKNIGVQQGTTSDIMVEKLINDGVCAGATSTGYTAPAVAAASIGKIDAVVTDKLTAETIVANNEGKYQCFKLVKTDGSDAAESEYYGIAVPQNSPDLLAVVNTVVNRLIADGSISKWEQEYQDIAKGLEG